MDNCQLSTVNSPLVPPAGYKRTEVGVIPEDWETQPISALVEVCGGGTPSTTVDEYWDGQIPWVSAGDVSRANGRYIQNTMENISKQGLASSSTKVMPPGTIVIIARGATVGRMAQIESAMAFNQTCYGLLPVKETDQDYLYYAMLFSVNSMKALTYGTVFGTITINSFEQWRIPLPPLPEQRAIAEVLSDVDALIAALDRLIAKKRAIKQGAMQQLLTGQTRLPGFSGAWVDMSISELVSGRKELFDDGDWIESEFIIDKGVRLVQTGNIGEGRFIDKESKKYISLDSFEKLKCKEVKPGDILICRLAEPAGRACILPDIGEGKIITAVDVSIFRPLDSLADRRYLVNVFCTSEWFNNVSERCGGTTRSRIARSKLGEMKINLPPLPEQRAIAKVLTDMDAEIAALEARRDKTRAIKQGMMQELLTGRIRLIN